MYSARSSDPVHAATVAATGTHHVRFERFESIVDALASDGTLPQPIVLQVGGSGPGGEAGAGLWVTPYLRSGQLADLMTNAEVVITHGGPGLIFQALASGHAPVAVARSAARGEAVDAHQEAFVAQLADEGLVRPARTTEEARAALAHGASSTRSEEARLRGATATFLERLDPLVEPLVREAPLRDRLFRGLLSAIER